VYDELANKSLTFIFLLGFELNLHRQEKYGKISFKINSIKLGIFVSPFYKLFELVCNPISMFQMFPIF
jgi:hypothetical protein